METIEFKLLSGLECEVRRFLTKHQALLFPVRQDRVNLAKNITAVLSDVIVRIGTDENITKEKCASLLSADRKQILFQVARFTNDYMKFALSSFEGGEGEGFDFVEYADTENTFSLPMKFNYAFEIEDDKKDEVFIDETFEITMKAYPFQNECLELSDLEKHREFEVTLPNKKKIRLQLMTGQTEANFSNLKASQIDLNLAIKMYLPRWVETREIGKQGQKEAKEIAIKAVDVESLEIYESAVLRKAIEKNSGNFQSVIVLNHPEIEGVNALVDVMKIPEFFFPAIEENLETIGGN